MFVVVVALFSFVVVITLSPPSPQYPCFIVACSRSTIHGKSSFGKCAQPQVGKLCGENDEDENDEEEEGVMMITMVMIMIKIVRKGSRRTTDQSKNKSGINICFSERIAKSSVGGNQKQKMGQEASFS